MSEGQLALGLLDRDLALARVAEGEDRARAIEECRRYMVWLYRHRKAAGTTLPAVTGDDATQWLDEHYPGRFDNRIVGAVFRPKSGWRFVATVPSLLRKRHGRRISAWAWSPSL